MDAVLNGGGNLVETRIVLEIVPEEVYTTDEEANEYYQALKQNFIPGLKQWLGFEHQLSFGMLSFSVTCSLDVGGSTDGAKLSTFMICQGIEMLEAVQCATVISSYEVIAGAQGGSSASLSPSAAVSLSAAAAETKNVGSSGSSECVNWSTVFGVPLICVNGTPAGSSKFSKNSSSTVDTKWVNEMTKKSVSRLQDLEEAQLASTVSLPALLSSAELQQLLGVCERIRKEVGAVNARKGARTEAGTETKTVESTWQTVYLNTNNLLKLYAPELYQKFVEVIRREDSAHWGLIDDQEVNVRVAEFHTVLPGGSLADPGHYDWGSLVTLDIMLSEPSTDFEGGEFVLPRGIATGNAGCKDATGAGGGGGRGKSNDGGRGDHVILDTRPWHDGTLSIDARVASILTELQVEPGNRSARVVLGGAEMTSSKGEIVPASQLLASAGDAIVFPSHKRHMVRPVRSGCRRVCVIEFWNGVARSCSHRCDRHWGGCDFELVQQ
jgi:hypothetical protein